MSRINPTLRGFLIIAAIAGVIVVLRLQTAPSVLYAIAWIAFMLLIVLVAYLIWRERRSEISIWPGRAQWVVYGAAILMLADIAAISFMRTSGLDAVAFIGVLAASGFAMWRVWKDQNTLV